MTTTSTMTATAIRPQRIVKANGRFLGSNATLVRLPETRSSMRRRLRFPLGRGHRRERASRLTRAQCPARKFRRPGRGFALTLGLERRPTRSSAEEPELLLDFLDEFYGDADEASRTHRLAVLASFFDWAYRSERISRDPRRRIE